MDLYSKTSTLNNQLTPEQLQKVEQFRKDPHTANLKPEFIIFYNTPSAITEEKVAPPNLEQNDSIKSAQTGESQENPDQAAGEESLKHPLPDNGVWDNNRAKKFKNDDRGKKRERLTMVKQERSADKKLCSSVSNSSRKCQYGDKCKYSHDIDSFMQTKIKDIDTTCYVFQTYGKCPFGVTCRFSADHVKLVDGVYTSIVNTELVMKSLKTCQIYNVLDGDLRTKLWKRKYDFSRSDKIHKTVDKYVHANRDSFNNLKYHRTKGLVQRKEVIGETTEAEVIVEADEIEPDTTNVTVISSNTVVAPKIGSITNEDLFKLRQGEKKKIDWKNKTYLAPLTTTGNLPFRRICKEFGVDITCGEMAMGTNLLSGQASEWALLKRHASEDLFGVQLAGSYPDSLSHVCQVIQENCKVDFVDLNCGCPIDLVFNKGAGCALMTRLDHYQKIVRSLDILLDVPVTVKIRTGVKEDVRIAHDIIPQIKTWGVSMITLHGRSRQQRYSKLADWSYINECAILSDPVPLFGCGDILTFHDYNEHMQNTNISGCMIARGALYKPWLFTEIKEQRDWDISASERFDILKKYVNYGLEHWGSDTQGVETTRRFLLEWLSFLFRYIPVGIMEALPQRMNIRPPYFFCRNELETLMASPNSSDWIKISELFLGPVPDGFLFTPKHKANAF